MSFEANKNYLYHGFGFAIQFPVDVTEKITQDHVLKALKDKVATHLLTYKYNYTGAMLLFLRDYMALSTREMCKILNVSQMTILNWEKKNDLIELTNRQRWMMVFRLKQFISNKQEIEIIHTLDQTSLSGNKTELSISVPLKIDLLYFP